MALRAWDHLLGEGWDIAANGGSDLHATDNVRGYAVGLPTTVVYAAQLVPATPSSMPLAAVAAS